MPRRTPLIWSAAASGISCSNKPSLDVDVVLEGSAAPGRARRRQAYKAKLISHPQFLTYTLQLRGRPSLWISPPRARKPMPNRPRCPSWNRPAFRKTFIAGIFPSTRSRFRSMPSDFGHVWDPFGGVEDLQAGRIRVLHAQSFKDDPTRIFRAARFAGRFGYDLEWRTREWLTEAIVSAAAGAPFRRPPPGRIDSAADGKGSPAGVPAFVPVGALPFLVPESQMGKIA